MVKWTAAPKLGVSGGTAARYGVAVAVFAVALAIRLAVPATARVPFLAFAAAIIVASGYGGKGPGILCVILTFFTTSLWFVDPRGSSPFDDQTAIQMLVRYASAAVCVALLAGALRNANVRRRAATAERDAQRAQLEATFNALQDGVVVFDREGKVVFINEAEAAINDFDSPERMRRDLAFFTGLYEVCSCDGHPLPVEQWPVSRAMRGERFSNVELRVTRTDIGRTWVISFSGAPVFDARGQQILAVTVSRDITESVRMREALAASEERYRRFVEVCPMGLVIGRIDGPRRGELSLVNDAYLRITGYSRDDFLSGRVRWDQITPPESVPADEAAVAEALAKGVAGPYEKEYIHKDGRHVPIVAALATMPATDEVAAFVLDISALRAAQDALASRTAELARSNQDLQQFAYAASHDLREPLRTVSSYVSLLARRLGPQLDTSGQAFMGYIEDGVRRMRTLIDDLLEYSRVAHDDTGFIEVDCNAALKQALGNLEANIERASATIRVAPLPTIRGRESRLVSLFQNLVGNAIAYSTDPPDVTIAASREHDGWRFAVKDTGIGIPAEQQEAVFGVFKRLHARDEYPGTGIGLAICRRIVEHHGGRIWVESEGIGKGCTFYFILPDATAAPIVTAAP